MEIIGKKPVELLAAYDQAIGVKHNWREWPLKKPEANKYVLVRANKSDISPYDYTEALLGYKGESLQPVNAWLDSDYEGRITDRMRCEWIYTDEI